MIYASELAVQAAGERPAGEPWTRDDTETCLFCAREITRGMHAAPFKMPRSFVDQPSIYGGQFACGYCAATVGRFAPSGFGLGDILQKQNVLICKDAIYPLKRAENLRWFLMQPPEPPFVVSIRTAKVQHVVWKAPVTLDLNAIRVQVGNETLLIRYRHLFDSVLPAARELADTLRVRQKKRSVRHPFQNWRRAYTARTGDLHSVILEAAKEDPETRRSADVLLAATIGELWASSYLLKDKTIKIEKPDPVITTKGV